MAPPPEALLPEAAYDTVTAVLVGRALELQVELVPGPRSHLYCVSGGGEPHYVNLLDQQYLCDCIDHDVRRRLCKHLICVLIRLGDYRLWSRLHELVEAEAAREEHSARLAAGGG